MAITRYSDVSSLINDIYEGALFTLQEQNLLSPTVTAYNAQGMMPRNATRYGQSTWQEYVEGSDTVASSLDRSLLATLTPTTYRDTFLITDQRMETDSENIMTDGARVLGEGAARLVDTQIISNFADLTGGTLTPAGGTITWDTVANARAILAAKFAPGPYYCVLHPYTYNELFKSAAVNSSEMYRAPQFQDRLVDNYFINRAMGDVIFVTNANLSTGSTIIQAMYSPMALALDIRKDFNVRPQRDESREATELNASLWFAHGGWDTDLGVQIKADATAPTS